ncbi:MAG: hypothetical protein M3416_03775 [Acidobacteriota bacterium]|nr:hypothetical protein [Acidobacteriota bacterium]
MSTRHPGPAAETPADDVERYIHSLMPENVCCGTLRGALQNLIIVLAPDGWYYIAGRHGNQFIALCPWCGKQLITDEDAERAFREGGR